MYAECIIINFKEVAMKIFRYNIRLLIIILFTPMILIFSINHTFDKQTIALLLGIFIGYILSNLKKGVDMF